MVSPAEFEPPRAKDSFELTPWHEGRRSVEFSIGPMQVNAQEIHATALTPWDWDMIQHARTSYSRWGEDIGAVQEDPYDGRDPDSLFDVSHFVSVVKYPGKSKVVTMRSGAFKPGKLDVEHLPEELLFWQVIDRDSGITVPLWTAIQNRFAQRSPHTGEPVDSNIAAISRAGTFTSNDPTDVDSNINSELMKEMQHDASAIAFSAIQLLAADNPRIDLITATLCKEVQENAFSIMTGQGDNRRKVMLDFTRTQARLGLDEKRYKVGLDRKNPTVQMLKTNFPGYWNDNDDAAHQIAKLLNDGTFPDDFFEDAFREIEPNMSVTMPGNEDLVRILTQPNNFKFLIPHIESSPVLRETIIYGVDDGPFSALLSPAEWHDSAKLLLHEADLKYRNLSR